MVRIFVGWDSREAIAYDVARHSIESRASVPVEVTPIRLQQLVEQGLYTREIDPLASTEFTYSRFLTPHLAGYDGWALFVDCDFLFLADVGELLEYTDPSKALYCVQHDYRPTEATKMDGKVQTVYPRKNWSSLMWLNCAHPSVCKLSVDAVNARSGAWLHRMQWATDEEIGELPFSWNFLEGWYEKPAQALPKAVHFTRGGPWFENWQDVDYADLWRAERDTMLAAGG